MNIASRIRVPTMLPPCRFPLTLRAHRGQFKFHTSKAGRSSGRIASVVSRRDEWSQAYSVFRPASCRALISYPIHFDFIVPGFSLLRIKDAEWRRQDVVSRLSVCGRAGCVWRLTTKRRVPNSDNKPTSIRLLGEFGGMFGLSTMRVGLPRGPRVDVCGKFTPPIPVTDQVERCFSLMVRRAYTTSGIT